MTTEDSKPADGQTDTPASYSGEGICKDATLKAIDCFKDWSNYLLVTTVAAIGWVATNQPQNQSCCSLWIRFSCLICFGASVWFGIITLAMIPRICEQTQSSNNRSIFDVPISYKWVWLYCDSWPFLLKHFCWWQHVLFCVGIGLYILCQCPWLAENKSNAPVSANAGTSQPQQIAPVGSGQSRP
jgi:hypothetical protein